MKSEYSIDSKNDEIFYLNIALFNNSTSDIPAYTNLTFTEPILHNPQDYLIATARFSISTSSLPIFQFKDDTYYVSLSFGNVSTTQVLIWIPSDPNSSVNDRNVYNIFHFVRMVNVALNTCFNTLNGLTVLPVGSVAPFIEYNPVTSLFSLYAKQGIYYPDDELNINNNTISIYFNRALFFKTSGYEAQFFGYSSDPLAFKILCHNKIGTNNFTYNGNTYNVMSQDSENLQDIIDVNTIQIVSSIPINSEFAPNIVKDIYGPNQSTTNVLRMVTDFQPIQESLINSLSGFIQYQPSGFGNYRWINFNGSAPLKVFDIGIRYQNKDGTVNSLTISPGFSFSFKFAFIKKSAYLNMMK